MTALLSTGFILLLMTTAFSEPAAWETAAYHWFQSQRTPVLDRIMLHLTMSADWQPCILIAVLMIGLLWFDGQRWLSVHLTLIAVFAGLAVPSIKILIARPRPVLLSGELQSFSFPSGHSAVAVLVAGTLTLLLLHGHRVQTRRLLLFLTTIYCLLAGMSRVYLSVHWMSDILAGFLFASILLVPFAWQIQQQGLADHNPYAFFRPGLVLPLVLAIHVVYQTLMLNSEAALYGIV